MRIENHKLVDHWYKLSPNTSGTLSKPSLIVMHYTASGGENPLGDANYLSQKAAKASAHIVVGRDGTIKQIVPFNVRAWHAGVSVWRGRSNVNDFSIGIEIDNWGPLTRTEGGQFKSWTGEVIDPNMVGKMKHKNETNDRYWEIYTEAQLRAVADVTEALLAAYPSITEIVGHDDIAPKRKTDPGPAFPMQRMISLMTGRDDKGPERRRVIASALNVRGGMGTQFDRVGKPLPNGEVVEVLYDAGVWAQIETEDGRTGWVNDTWLSKV